MLTSFSKGLTAAVIGASGGIGGAIAGRLGKDPSVARVLALSRSGRAPDGDRIEAGRIDIEDEAAIEAAAKRAAALGPVGLVIVATGVLHDETGLAPEKSWRELDAGRLARSFAVNATGPALIAKHFLPLLPREGKAVFAALSARVGSIGDNRLGGWFGYRASKAALNMLIRSLAIELARKRGEAVCVGLHPGTVDTGLSAPFQGGVKPDGLFTPEQSAGHLLTVIDGLTAADSGGVFAWDGTVVPE